MKRKRIFSFWRRKKEETGKEYFPFRLSPFAFRLLSPLSFLQHRRIILFWLVTVVALMGPWLLQRYQPKLKVPGPSALVSTTACITLEVYDGDTLILSCEQKTAKVRLYCIDAPELDQGPWGEQSKVRLMGWIGTLVRVRQVGTDFYGRVVGEVTTPEGANLNVEQVKSGWAAVLPSYCNDPLYYQVQAQAREQSLGIWTEPGLHQTPWVWRRKK